MRNLPAAPKTPEVPEAHNHPSGKLAPSGHDDAITQQVRKAAELVDIILHDHIIVTKEGYYSYKDEGKL